MAENNDFLESWFKGFASSLDLLPTAERRKVLTECGKACSELKTKKVYEESWAASEGDLQLCVRKIHEKLSPEVLYEPVDEAGIPDGKCYDVVYSRCHCELVSKKYIEVPALCECSRQSLLNNWENVVGKGNVSVEIKQTILNNAESCIMRVTFR